MSITTKIYPVNGGGVIFRINPESPVIGMAFIEEINIINYNSQGDIIYSWTSEFDNNSTPLNSGEVLEIKIPFSELPDLNLVLTFGTSADGVITSSRVDIPAGNGNFQSSWYYIDFLNS